MKKVLCYFSFLMLLCCTFACKKKAIDPCEIKTCQPNAICNNGKCECESTAYKVRDNCVPKTADTYYYAGKSYNCMPDTFTIKFIKNTTDLSAGYMSVIIPAGNTFGNLNSSCDYYPSVSGDSIRSIDAFHISKCVVKGVECQTEVMCKIKNQNELAVTVRYFELSNYSKTLDTHRFTMKK